MTIELTTASDATLEDVRDALVIDPNNAARRKSLSDDLRMAYQNPFSFSDSAISDGTTAARAAITAADALGPVMLPTGTYAIASNLTIANHISFSPGAKIKPASGVTVTLSGGYTTDDAQHVFDISAGGVIAVSSRSYVTPYHWGLVAGGSASTNRAALQACFDAHDVNKFTAGTYDFDDTISALGNNISGVVGLTILNYTGTRDRIALKVGAVSGSSSQVRLEGFIVNSATPDWSNSAFVGVEATNLKYSSVNDVSVVGFRIGWQAYGYEQGYVYNAHVNLRTYRCKEQMVLMTRGAGWVNENTWIKSYFGNSSSDSASGDGYGIVFRQYDSESYQNHNNNSFYSPNFELAAVDGVERIPFIFEDCGLGNYCYDARHENNSVAFARFEGDFPRGNILQVGYFGGNSTATAIYETQNRKNNVIGPGQFHHTTNVNLSNVVSGYSDTASQIRLPFHFIHSNGSLLQGVADAGNRKGVSTIDRGVGFFVQVPTLATVIQLWTNGTGTHREQIQAFDAAGNLLSPVSDYLAVSDINSNSTVVTTFGGSSFRTGGDGRTGSAITKLSNTVAFIRVVLIPQGGTIYGASLISEYPLAVLAGVSFPPTTSYLPIQVAPDDLVGGYYRFGDVLTQSTGDKWNCTLDGYKAADWASSTAYRLYVLRTNDSGKVYECVTAGTSASSGGPTGTGAAITDGTCVWNYVGVEAVFEAA